MTLELLYQTEDTVVINKPSAMAVHRSRMVPTGPFLVPILKKQLGCTVHPIHRLDRPTSGCLLLALNPERAKELQEGLTSPKADKRYLALVRGRWTHPEPLIIDRPIADDNKIMRDCLTEAWCLGASADPRCSLILARTHTGRYHQVRRHLNGVTHPVLGDTKHGDSKVNRDWRDNRDLPRLALHCWQLDLTMASGERLCVRAPIPEDLLAVFEALPWWDQAKSRLAAFTTST